MHDVFVATDTSSVPVDSTTGGEGLARRDVAPLPEVTPNVLNMVKQSRIPGMNWSPMLDFILNKQYHSIDQFPKVDLKAYSTIFCGKTGLQFSGTEKNRGQAFDAFMSRLVTQAQQDPCLLEVIQTPRTTAPDGTYYPKAAAYNESVAIHMGFVKEQFTQNITNLFDTIWNHYDSQLSTILHFACTGSAFMLQRNAANTKPIVDGDYTYPAGSLPNRHQNISGWLGLQIFSDAFASKAIGAKLENIQKVITYKLPQNKPPGDKLADFHLLLGCANDSLKSGLTEELQVLFLFNALPSGYDGLKNTIITQNGGLDNMKLSQLVTQIGQYYETAIKLLNQSGSQHINSTFVNHKDKGKRPFSHGASGSGLSKYQKNNSSDTPKSKCKKCGKKHDTNDCKAVYCTHCKNKGYKYPFHMWPPAECKNKGTINATKAAAAKSAKSSEQYTVTKEQIDTITAFCKSQNKINNTLGSAPKSIKTGRSADQRKGGDAETDDDSADE